METILILVTLSLLAGAIAGFGGSSAFIPIIALILITPLTTTEISGTAATSFFIATFFGTYLYWRSGNHNKTILTILIPPALIGTQIGVYINSFISADAFNLIIGTIAIILAILLLRPILLTETDTISINTNAIHGKLLLITLGLTVGIIAGITGIGGIPLIVPTLIILNINPLTSISTGFAVATFNTFITSISYIRQGSVQFEYVLYIGIPFALAQTIGWKYSQKVNKTHLKIGLSIFNMLLGLYMVGSILV